MGQGRPGFGFAGNQLDLLLQTEHGGHVKMMGQERDLIGVVLHLTEVEYQQLAAKWHFQMPESYQCTVDQLMQCRYAAIAVQGQWKAIIGIDAWRVGVRKGAPMEAEFSRFSEDVAQLKGAFPKCEAEISWLNIQQQNGVSASLESELAKYRPSKVPPCLDLNAAAEAVSRHYGVEPDQVQISIHRKVSLDG